MSATDDPVAGDDGRPDRRDAVGGPGHTTLPVRGTKVRLRDVAIDDADLLDAWSASPKAKGEYNDFGLEPSQADREGLARGLLRNVHNGELVVERVEDGQPIGHVSWHRVGYGPNDQSAAWNIGIALLPEARGHGYGPEAQRLLADYLFATTPFDRVEASTDVDNAAEQRALEKAGYLREGILRGAQHRAGARRDLVTYARLRSDP